MTGDDIHDPAEVMCRKQVFGRCLQADELANLPFIVEEKRHKDVLQHSIK
jgi:hypothetical protein